MPSPPHEMKSGRRSAFRFNYADVTTSARLLPHATSSGTIHCGLEVPLHLIESVGLLACYGLAVPSHVPLAHHDTSVAPHNSSSTSTTHQPRKHDLLHATRGHYIDTGCHRRLIAVKSVGWRRNRQRSGMSNPGSRLSGAAPSSRWCSRRMN